MDLKKKNSVSPCTADDDPDVSGSLLTSIDSRYITNNFCLQFCGFAVAKIHPFNVFLFQGSALKS